MPILKTIKYILQHPINKNQKPHALYRFLKWQMISRINAKDMVWPFIEGSQFIVARSKYSLTANIYCGLNDFEEMGILLHFLRPEDLFLSLIHI